MACRQRTSFNKELLASIVKSKSHFPCFYLFPRYGGHEKQPTNELGVKKRPNNTPLNPLCPKFVFIITLSFITYSLCFFFCLNFSFDLIAYTFSYYQRCFWSEGGQYTRVNGP